MAHVSLAREHQKRSSSSNDEAGGQQRYGIYVTADDCQ